MASHTAPSYRRPRETDSGAFFKVATVLLGILVAVIGLFALLMWADARNTWVTETSLSTALNLSYMAEQLALFGIVVGFALVLAGIGFLVLAIGGALRHAGAEAPAAEKAALA